MAGMGDHATSRLAKNRRRASGLLAFVLSAGLLAGCSTAMGPQNQVGLPTPAKPQMSEAHQREHQRILSAYGGSYESPRLQPMLTETVEKLVAASERPDLKYEVTILNSPSVNAFALPTGQLYVTRGLLALANDNSELASVLSHEMAHVIARHAAIREDQARQAALMNRVATDLLSDPQLGALALAKSKITLASFSRAQEFEADGIGVGIAARAGYDPYGAQRFLTSLGLNSQLRAKSANIDPRAPDFLSSHPATPERVTNVQSNARQFASPNNAGRAKADYLAMIDGLVFGEDPSEGFVRGRPDLDETIRRLKAFAEAGADCLYAPGIKTPEQIAAVVKAVAPKPVNFLMAAATDLTLKTLAELGVRRVSLGGTLARVAWTAVTLAARDIAEAGKFDGLAGTMANAELNRFFRSNAHAVELDSAGRVMLGSKLAASVGIDRDVAVIGAGDCLELWDPSTWEAYHRDLSARGADLTASLGHPA